MSEHPRKQLARGAQAREELEQKAKLIIRQIQDYRAKFSLLEKIYSSAESRYGDPKPQIFPVISICGERGAGKTSTLLTFLKLFKDVALQHGDIVLSVQDPHRFKDDDRLIHWFFAGLAAEVKNISERLSNGCDFYRRESLNDDVRNLQSEFERLQEVLYRAFPPRRAKFDYNKPESRFRVQYLAEDLSFPQELAEFIERLTDLRKKERNLRDCEKTSSSDKDAPLVLFPVDDADLTPEYLDDLLDFLRIVVPSVQRLVLVLTTNLELALINRKVFYYKTICRHEWSDIEIPEIIVDRRELVQTVNKMAEQFITKFIPREGRINLLPLSNQEKLDFRVPFLDADSQSSPKLLQLLNDCELDSFFFVDWFANIHNQADTISSHLFYADILSNNRRLLEEVYIFLFGEIERLLLNAATETDKATARRKLRFDIIKLLLEQAIGWEEHDAKHYFKGIVSEEIFANEIATRRTTEIKPCLSFVKGFTHSQWIAIALPESVKSKGKVKTEVKTETLLLEIYFNHEPKLEWIVQNAKRDISTIDNPLLTQAFLLLAELKRPGFIEKTALKAIAGVNWLQAEGSEFKPIIPFNVIRLTDNNNTIESFTLPFPLPTWSFPYQSLLFAQFWNLFVEEALSRNRVIKLGDLLFNAINGINWISWHGAFYFSSDEPAIDGAKSIQRLPEQPVRIEFDMPLASIPGLLTEAYRRDIEACVYNETLISGVGGLAYWLECQLIPFINQLGGAELSAEMILNSAVKPVAEQLLKWEPELASAEWGKLKARILNNDSELVLGSLVIWDYRSQQNFVSGIPLPKQFIFDEPKNDSSASSSA